MGTLITVKPEESSFFDERLCNCTMFRVALTAFISSETVRIAKNIARRKGANSCYPVSVDCVACIVWRFF